VLWTGYEATDAPQGSLALLSEDRPPGPTACRSRSRSRSQRLRQSEGVSVSELASVLEIGVRRVVAIERGEGPSRLSSCSAFAGVFESLWSTFLSSTLTERPFLFVLHAADIPRLPVTRRRSLVDKGWSETEYRSLAAGFGRQGMYPYYAKLRHSVGATAASLHEHHGQEFVYVLSGRSRW